MARTRWDLPKGRWVEQRGQDWLLFDGPGKLLYQGNAEGLQVMLRRLGVDV